MQRICKLRSSVIVVAIKKVLREGLLHIKAPVVAPHSEATKYSKSISTNLMADASAFNQPGVCSRSNEQPALLGN